MKYLEAKKKEGKAAIPSIIPSMENKMMPGTRLDQRDPTTLISSPRAAGRSSDNAKALAEELGVDLKTVKGSGAHGEVTSKDVRLAKKRMDEADETAQDSVIKKGE